MQIGSVANLEVAGLDIAVTAGRIVYSYHFTSVNCRARRSATGRHEPITKAQRRSSNLADEFIKTQRCEAPQMPLILSRSAGALICLVRLFRLPSGLPTVSSGQCWLFTIAVRERLAGRPF
jgi:hypothetical protein